LCAFFDQRNAAGRARSAEQRETLPHGPTATCNHEAPLGIGVDGDDLHLVPVGLQLVCHDAGERGADVLTHLRANDVDCYRAAWIDSIPDGGFEEVARAASGVRA